MREMKDSGVEWIGEIPSDWEIKKLANVACKITDYVASGSFASLNENVMYLDEPDYAMLVRIADLSGTKDKRVYINQHAYEFLQNSNLHGGEVILSNIGSVGNVFYYEPLYERSSLAPNAIMVDGSVNNKFLYYWFLCPIANEELKRIGGNAVQLKFNKTQLRQFKVLFPPCALQDSIVSYLDSKCSKIDEIIAKQELIIEKLKEYKLSVITEAVTKGLDPDVEMKDSGVDWIGTIPVCWTVSHIGNLAVIGSGGTPSRNNPEYWNGDIPWMSSGEINNEYVYDTDEYITELGMKNSNAKLLPINTVMLGLIGQGKTKGLTAITKIECTCNQNLAYLIPDEEKLYYEYLFYCFKAMYKYIRGVVGDSQAGIYQGVLKKQYIPIPVVSIQKRVCDYLDNKCLEINNSISVRTSLIQKMLEFKKSFIYETVTGKKDVVTV